MMDTINQILDFILQVIYYLPTILGDLADKNVDFGAGLSATELSHVYAGCEVVAILMIAYMMLRKRAGGPTDPPATPPQE